MWCCNVSYAWTIQHWASRGQHLMRSRFEPPPPIPTAHPQSLWAGEHPVRCDWQQHSGGSPGTESERKTVPLGNRWRYIHMSSYSKCIIWTCSNVINAVFLSSVENQSHCDFVKLRNMLICSHMHDLKDVTCDIHYENYRAQCIQEMTRYLRTEPKSASSRLLPASPFTRHSFHSWPFILFSKLAEDNHMESPVAILPLPTHDGETEKLIKSKDKEVRSNFFCFHQTFNTDCSVDLLFFSHMS